MPKQLLVFLRVAVALILLGYTGVAFFRHLKEKAIHDTYLAPIAYTFEAARFISDSDAVNQLAQYTGQFVLFQAEVCDYCETSDGDIYLDLTAALQTDSSVVIAQLLESLHWNGKGPQDACDSSKWRTQRLYNFKEHDKKIFISAEIIQAAPDVKFDRLHYNEPCRWYSAKQKRNVHHLENFCYDHVTVKAQLRSVRYAGDSIYISMDGGWATELRENTWKFN